MEVIRLVITGPVGAGKSTFIRSISEIEVVDTDRKATDDTALLKQQTTIAFDFGRLQFGPDQVLHLYGTPGQDRFDFIWDMLITKAHGLILLVAAHRPYEFRYAYQIMSFMRERADIPMLVGVTHTDSSDAWSVENVAIALGLNDDDREALVVAVDATDPGSVAQALITLLEGSMQPSLI
ncbi:GTP-binding protein [Pseudanabaena sp. PCC 6802]|uniref:GTP-binding protein n=1 Tax=Pseudanabaena sp. PCC 6802 TaxID=118173 RepID=UPI000349D50B|nr:ATP/GTP-binding protein [Pseudanabaena sp. PCC 6802]